MKDCKGEPILGMGNILEIQTESDLCFCVWPGTFPLFHRTFRQLKTHISLSSKITQFLDNEFHYFITVVSHTSYHKIPQT